MKKKIPTVWENCKTKEEKDLFLKDLRDEKKHGKGISFQEFLLRQYKKELRGE